jgi:hypothetical protein
MLDFFVKYLNTVNTTNLRIFTTLVVYLLTTVVYLIVAFLDKNWHPSIEWLAFIGLMAGIDTLQYVGKRATHIAPDGETVYEKIKNNTTSEVRKSEGVKKVESDGETATTDIQEIKPTYDEIG